MANTSVLYPDQDGSVRDFAVPFEYLSEDYVKVTVDDVDASFTFLSTYLVRMDAYPTGDVRVYRQTPVDPINEYTDGSVLVDDDLNLSFLQALHVSEEANDGSALAIEYADETRDLVDAATAAAAAATSAANTATATAADAVDTADDAIAIANTANTTANTANTTANNAQTAVTAAVADIDAALVDINAALVDVNAVVDDVDAAVATANAASAAADLVSDTANDALTKANANETAIAALATVATTGDYDDLTNKPTLFSGAYADLTGAPALATVATTGAYADLTGAPTLFSGAYADLTGKPTIPDSADDISYDNTISGLTATNVKTAIDELESLIGTGGVDVDAVDVDYSNATSGLSATTVQAAIDELVDELGYELVTEYTVPSAASFVTFTDLGAYKNLRVLWRGVQAVSGASNFRVQVSPDNGTTWRAQATIFDTAAATNLIYGILEFFDFNDANWMTNLNSRAIEVGNTDQFWVNIGHTANEAHNAIRFSFSGASVDVAAGTFRIYGEPQ